MKSTVACWTKKRDSPWCVEAQDGDGRKPEDFVPLIHVDEIFLTQRGPAHGAMCHVTLDVG